MRRANFEEKSLTKEEVKVVYKWLVLAIYEGGGAYGDDFRAWFPVIKKMVPSKLYKEVASSINDARDKSMAQEFLEYVYEAD